MGTLDYSTLTKKWSKTRIDVSALQDGDYYIFIYFENYATCGHSIHIVGDSSEFAIDNTPPLLGDMPNNVEYVVGTRGHQVKWLLTDLHPGYYYIYLDGALDAQGSWQSGQEIVYNIDGFEIGRYNITIVVKDSHENQIIHEVVLTVTEAKGTNWLMIVLMVIIIVAAVLVASLVLIRRRSIQPIPGIGKGVYKESLDQIVKNIIFLLEGIPSIPIEKIAEKIGCSYNETEELLVILTYREKIKGFIEDGIYYNEAEYLD